MVAPATRLALTIQSAARQRSVAAVVHPEDHIFNFLAEHPGFPNDESRIAYYFDDGRRSAGLFRDLVDRWMAGRSRPLEVLEFASGYGCVTRHLLGSKDISLHSCDIHAEAVGFLEKEIGVRALQSATCPEDLALPKPFDVVFALSFFSHMPITTWTRWLVRLAQAVKPGGILAFTTQGLASRPFLGNPTIPDLGFWFEAASEQKDLPTEQYGQAIVTPTFVKKSVLTMSFVELLEAKEAFWWGHQDLYVLRRKG